jgi:DNA primase
LSQETILAYGIGYAPADGRTLDQKDPARRTLLTEAGLLVESEGRYFERFRDRLMFPIRDARGRAVAFGGRLIADSSAAAAPAADVLAKKPAKYLNSPETAIFHKQSVLYGLHEARAQIMREKTAFVVEGYMDVVILAQHGVGNAVACMGTALTTQQLQLLLRFTDRICIVFDGDDAGRKAAGKSMETALPLLESHQAISFLTLPDKQDPDEYLGEHGKDKFLALAKAAPTLAQYLLASLVQKFGTDGQLSTPESKAQFSQALSSLLATMRPANRLRHIIQQEAQSILSPARVGKSNLSPQDRLRQLSQAGPGYSPSWRPMQPPAPPAHLQASLWSQLYDAAAAAPEKAREMAQSILPVLDSQNAEESRLAGLLEMLVAEGAKFDVASGELSQARKQSASDLLASAHRLIERRRTREVEEALKGLREAGELSEQDYPEQMLALPR